LALGQIRPVEEVNIVKTILIVDDEILFLEALCNRLKEAKEFTIDTAVDGEGALLKIKNNPPDLVILDLKLPRLQGEDVLRSIKGDPKTAQVPVIISTAKNEIGSMINLMNLGATDYLIKPYEYKELIRIIEAYT
jgi:two-component system alkaline phosphatase synthesis response regulator PhoP